MSTSIPEPVCLFYVPRTEFLTFTVEATTCEGYDDEDKEQDDGESSDAYDDDDNEPLLVIYWPLTRSCARGW